VAHVLDTVGVIPIASFIILSPYASLRSSEKTTGGVILLEVLIFV
jgi:hypothetical protein